MLQNAWERSTNYSLDQCEEPVKRIKEIVSSNPDHPIDLNQTLDRGDLNTNLFEDTPGQFGVVSNEDITSHSYPSGSNYDDLSRTSLESFAAVLAPYAVSYTHLTLPTTSRV